MSTKMVDVQEAQTRFAEILSLAMEGTEVILVSRSTPIARLVPIVAASKPRIAGINRGTIWTSDDFDSRCQRTFGWVRHEAPAGYAHLHLLGQCPKQTVTTCPLAQCTDRANTLLLSVASVWEMQIKVHLGKLKLQRPLAEIIESQQRINSIEVVPMQLAHVLALEGLPPHHLVAHDSSCWTRSTDGRVADGEGAIFPYKR